ncbi:PTS transporter subunit EIIC [Spiroplasma endosymbiont of Amphibalanus improvisus]|uniref:PTS transporter subunit EIIC n=1 Tax=Spiroplasma endosymbiont of Amphibalanus improvisus TaxID=3066327 RepID=UPI00313EA793
MAKKDANKTASELLSLIGDQKVQTVTNCQTRLRINLNSGIDKETVNKIKSTETVLGVIQPSDKEIQIVLGPGWVTKVREKFEKIWTEQNNEVLNSESSSDEFKSAGEQGAEFKTELRKKQTSWIQLFLAKFSKIFAPMIIGFIGAGILSGVAGILQSTASTNGVWDSVVAQSWFNFLSVSLNLWKDAFIVIVGWRTTEVFGGSGVLGAIAACMYVPSFATQVVSPFVLDGTTNHYTFLGIHISNNLHNWLIVGFRPAIDANGVINLSYASGNILGALLAGGTVLWLEKGVRKIVPNLLDTILTPTVVIFGMLFVNFFLLIPISGYLYTAVAWFFSTLYNNPFGAFFLASIFLLAVAFGVHQGFVPIYQVLIDQTGVNGLFPILAMAGFAQVGTAMTLYLLSEKGSDLRKQISGAIIPGIFGIGEPLIYGVTLPRIRPFITSSIGAGFGGFFMGAVSMWGGCTIGLNTMFGPSGLPAAFLMTTPDGRIGLAVSIYLLALLISATAGGLITYLGYSRLAMVGTAEMKKIYTEKNVVMWEKVLWTLAFITIIGIFAFWIYKYYQKPIDERKQINKVKVV